MNSEVMPRTTLRSAHAVDQHAPLPLPRVWRAYLLETKFEIVAALRTTGFILPFVIVPVAVYLLFGVVINAKVVAQTPGLANYLFCSFGAMAAMMPGIFSGVILAQEREGKLLLLKRALPLPPGATILAKLFMAMVVAAIAVLLVALSALLAGTITLGWEQLTVICLVLIVGTIPFTAIGLLIGALASASAAPAWGNLVFLPMLWLSGLFIPLPDFLKTWVLIWPAFHLNQLALGLAGIADYTYIPPMLAAAVLAGVSVLCGGLALRRLARVG